MIAETPPIRPFLRWRLITLLSGFGLAMGIATVSWMPSSIELILWFLIFDVTAYVLVKRAGGRYFLHGLLVGLVNCFWITSFQIIFFPAYIANHPEEAALISTLPIADSPRLVVFLTDVFIGLGMALILGLFAAVAGKFVKKPSDMIRMV